MSEQPKALRMAETPFSLRDGRWNFNADDELRRLHALCEEMGEALEAAHHVIGHPDCDGSKARAELIAKWKESK